MTPSPVPAPNRMTDEVVLTLSMYLPLRTVSLCNSREHWAKKARRAQTEREAVRYQWAALVAHNGARRMRGEETAFVHLERIAPRALDSGDNLPSAMKGCRDQIAAELGFDDRDPRYTWLYSQSKGAPKEYAVRVTVEIRRAGVSEPARRQG